MKNVIKKLSSSYKQLGRYIGAARLSPTQGQYQLILFALGSALLMTGVVSGVTAQGLETWGYKPPVDGGRVNSILTYMERTFGAWVMGAAGVGAIVASAYRQYIVALGCLVVAIGSFILRSYMVTISNGTDIQE